MCLEIQPISTTDFHFLPGRFRVGVPSLKGNPQKAGFLAHQLSAIAGVAGYVSRVTGRVLLIYNEQELRPADLLKCIARSVAKSNGVVPASRVQRPEQGQNGGVPWHMMDPEQVLRFTGTCIDKGLSSAEAQRRVERLGPNRLAVAERKSVLSMLLDSLGGFMSQLLLGAAAVSVAVGEKTDGAVITTIVALQAVLETFQSYRAEKSLAALRELSAPTANVIRDGREMTISAEQLVPGDLLRVEAGDKVPADARMLDSGFLHTDESCLTGESIPVVKDLAVQKRADLLTADRLNMLFAGTNVTKGKAAAVVTATGMDTEMGKIAALLAESGQDETYLHRQMELLGKKTTRLVLLSVGAIVGVGLLRRRPLADLLRTGVSLAVGAIPEGLPAVVTVALAFGVQRMARRQAIVRRLSAVESLGGVTTICTDKTGTLTANEMTVKAVYAGGEMYTVGGEGYRPAGEFYLRGRPISPREHPSLQQVLLGGALCSNAKLHKLPRGSWNINGDPTEGALLTLAVKGGIDLDALAGEFQREREIPFDSERRLMTVLSRDQRGKITVHVKGAPEAILPRCDRAVVNGEIVPLAEDLNSKILKVNQLMAGRALRVLGLAVKEGSNQSGDPEQGLIFTGLVGMVDPPRSGTKAAVRRCREAGIKVVMITGDHRHTADAIASKLGLSDGRTLTGQMLAELPEKDLVKVIQGVSVFARTTPEQKLRIVRALQNSGHTVAMTGDGINDAPAVKEANIGIAMGRSGTDVTREAAGIVLSDDNFATIVAGVEEGRTVAANIGKAARYILPGNWGQVLAVFLASVSGYSTPLVPSQILWINLVTEGFPALALAADPPAANCMQKGPRSPKQMLFSPVESKGMLYKALLSGLSTYALYAGGLSVFGWDKIKAKSMAFSHVVLSRTLSIFDSRSSSKQRDPNPHILPAAGLSTAMLLMTLYFPWLNPVFKTVPLNLSDWGILGVSAGILGRLDYWLGGTK